MPAPVEFKSNGRPAKLPVGPDGTPLRLTAAMRQSTAAPARVKIGLLGPATLDSGRRVMALACEFRMELN
jgi:hypothetical protein